MSSTEEPPVKQILETNMIQVVSQIFQFNDVSEEIRLMKVYNTASLTNYLVG
jgi:hypothetical protein